MNQKELVLERLNNGEWLPRPEALRWSPPITRLGARIFDLRAEGHNIIERKVGGKSWSESKLIPAVAPVLFRPFKEIPLPPRQNVEAKSQILFQ
jgi:hypothetical protein